MSFCNLGAWFLKPVKERHRLVQEIKKRSVYDQTANDRCAGGTIRTTQNVPLSAATAMLWDMSHLLYSCCVALVRSFRWNLSAVDVVVGSER